MILPSSVRGDLRLDLRARPRLWSAFTLIELLVATALLAILVLVLASIANHAMSLWSRNENKSEMREVGRTALDLISNEMRQVVLPLDRGTAVVPRTSGLQFVVNPASVPTEFLNRDTVFFQAPLATSRDRGDLAIVGYFVRSGPGNTGNLCRLFINPDDPDYRIHGTGDWMDKSLLDGKAPGDDANDGKGLFLENITGMWITAYDADGNIIPDYDSRAQRQLPARLEIALALVDRTGAARAEGGLDLPVASGFASVDDYLDDVTPQLLAHVNALKINISFEL